MIDIQNVTKVYQMGETEVRALDGIDVHIAQGEMTAIMGPSGSGKSTLLAILGCLDVPTSGVYRLGGESVEAMTDDQLADIRGRKIGFVFQQFFLAEHATVHENVADGLLYAGVPFAERRRLADEALERVGLADRASAKPGRLSGGQRQRVAIARAVVGRPAVVLADEPTGSLDSATGASILELLHDLNASGTTIAMITHDGVLADQLPRQIRLLDGQIVSDHTRPASA